MHKGWNKMDMNEMNIDTLRVFAEKYVKDEPNRLGTDGWWRSPLLATAPIDERFSQLPRIASPDHLHPNDLLATAKSVIVFFIPFTKDLVKENRNGDRPCRDWGLSYVQTNDLINRLGYALGDLLGKHGYQSGLTPPPTTLTK